MSALRTQDAGYAERLRRIEGVWWKRLLDVQRLYRAHLQRLQLGFTLEVGCGIGRNLLHLGIENCVGVDHNRAAVQMAKERGAKAFTPDELRASGYAAFDSLLFSHVLEHMTSAEALDLVRSHLPLLRAGGRLVVLAPQEAGFRSDPTHVEMMDFAKLAALAREAGLTVEAQYSFPLPRLAGKLFKYNEFVSIARKPR